MAQLNPAEIMEYVHRFQKATGLEVHKDEGGLLRIQMGRKLDVPFLKEVGGFVRLDTPGNTEGAIAGGLNMALEGNVSPEPPPLSN